jgi:beta-glucosidase-like glycosyl hydrolase
VTSIDASLDELRVVDFPPFRAAIDAGIGAVMVGHPIYEAIYPANPASLSPAVLDLLRSDSSTGSPSPTPFRWPVSGKAARPGM